MQMVVGYTLSGHDNGTFMFDENDPQLKWCIACHYRTDFFRNVSQR